MESQKLERSSEYDIGQDRLSKMPDEVLVNILSFMPFLDAVRTVLLRRFGNLWTFVHTLTFNDFRLICKLIPNNNWQRGTDVDERLNRFCRNVTMLHKRLSMNRIELYVSPGLYSELANADDDIKMWLRFVLEKQVKEIKLHEMSDAGICKVSVPSNFSSQSLVTLELCGCSIHCNTQVNLGSLKRLSLVYVGMHESALQQFLSGCPSVRELHIENPLWTKKLSSRSPNIERLSLVLDDDQPGDPLLIDFPNLKSLDLDIHHYLLPGIIDVSSLRYVYFRRLDCIYCRNDAMRKMFWEKFQGVEVVQFSRKASGAFFHAIQHLDLVQSRWKCIVLELEALSEGCLLGIYQLTRSLQHLEELIIYTKKADAYVDSDDVLPLKNSSPCVMPKLKTVTLHGCPKPWDHKLLLIEFVLKSAVILDKLVIVPGKRQLTAMEEQEFLRCVSNFQRSSPSAMVIFA